MPQKTNLTTGLKKRQLTRVAIVFALVVPVVVGAATMPSLGHASRAAGKGAQSHDKKSNRTQHPGHPLRTHGRAKSPAATAPKRQTEKLVRARDAADESVREIPERDRFFARHGFGRGFVGWAGAVFWPYGYHDLFDYTFWPSYGDAYDPFWAYGYDELVAGVFWPDHTDRADSAPAVRQRTADARANKQDVATAASLCNEDKTVPLAFEHISRAVQPSGEAAEKMQALERAAQDAAAAVEAACPGGIGRGPMARLGAVENRLAALLAAVETLQGALAEFYDSLDDRQKLRFDHLEGQRRHVYGPGVVEPQRSPNPPGRICGQHTAAVAQFPIDQIATTLLPRGIQTVRLEELRVAATAGAETVKASCPLGAPDGVRARLAAVQSRLAALRAAVLVVTPALQRFYASLDREQQRRVEQMPWSE
jgi:LTXXQ motif family protein